MITLQSVDECENNKSTIIKWAQGKWFKVDPMAIDQKIFEEERCNTSQEMVRNVILQAFEEVRKNPRKYARKFYTMLPICRVTSPRCVYKLRKRAYLLGNHMADWVEQALEWAQRLSNGETWQAVCNETDSANCRRLVLWKKGRMRLVGACKWEYDCSPSTRVSNTYFKYCLFYFVYNAEPLVVKYE